MVLVGNKCDLEDDRVVTKEQSGSLAQQWGVTFMETSARKKINVDEVLNHIVSRCAFFLSSVIRFSLIWSDKSTDKCRKRPTSQRKSA